MVTVPRPDGNKSRSGGIVTGEFLDRTLVKPLAPHWNWYLQLNPSRRGRGWRASSLDVTRSVFLMVDIDREEPFLKGGEKPEYGGQAALVAQAAVDLFRDSVAGAKVPHLALYSGRGVQVWFRLPDLFVTRAGLTYLDRVRRGAIEEMKRLWGDDPKWGAVDTSSADLPRVGRMPGTINTKTGQQSRILFVDDFDPDSAVWLGMERFKLPEPEPVVIREQTSNFIKVRHLLSKRAKEFLIKGEAEGSRHEAAYAAAISCLEAGLTEETTTERVLKGCEKCGLEAKDGRAAVRSALKKWREKIA